MYRIATKYGIPSSDLIQANINTGTTIKPGDKLIIPSKKPYRSTDTVIPYDSGEVNLLARLIEAEAAGESLQAKIAVVL